MENKVISRKELRQFNNTNENDICIGNDNYNFSKGYCSWDIFCFLNNIRKEKWGYDYKYHKLTKKILNEEFLIEVI